MLRISFHVTVPNRNLVPPQTIALVTLNNGFRLRLAGKLGPTNYYTGGYAGLAWAGSLPNPACQAALRPIRGYLGDL